MITLTNGFKSFDIPGCSEIILTHEDEHCLPVLQPGAAPTQPHISQITIIKCDCWSGHVYIMYWFLARHIHRICKAVNHPKSQYLWKSSSKYVLQLYYEVQISHTIAPTQDRLHIGLVSKKRTGALRTEANIRLCSTREALTQIR